MKTTVGTNQKERFYAQSQVHNSVSNCDFGYGVVDNTSSQG
jgi:hypothetical protein